MEEKKKVHIWGLCGVTVGMLEKDEMLGVLSDLDSAMTPQMGCEASGPSTAIYC